MCAHEFLPKHNTHGWSYVCRVRKSWRMYLRTQVVLAHFGRNHCLSMSALCKVEWPSGLRRSFEGVSSDPTAAQSFFVI
jgi:hypothetical protein